MYLLADVHVQFFKQFGQHLLCRVISVILLIFCRWFLFSGIFVEIRVIPGWIDSSVAIDEPLVSLTIGAKLLKDNVIFYASLTL